MWCRREPYFAVFFTRGRRIDSWFACMHSLFEYKLGENKKCTMAHNCHGKRKNLTAKEKTSRQKEKTARQREKVLFFLLWRFFFCRDSCGPPCIFYAPLTSTQKTQKKLLALCACPCFLSRGRGVVSSHLQIDDRKSCESPSWLEEKILLSE